MSVHLTEIIQTKPLPLRLVVNVSHNRLFQTCVSQAEQCSWFHPCLHPCGFAVSTVFNKTGCHMYVFHMCFADHLQRVCISIFYVRRLQFLPLTSNRITAFVARKSGCSLMFFSVFESMCESLWEIPWDLQSRWKTISICWHCHLDFRTFLAVEAQKTQNRLGKWYFCKLPADLQ